MARSRVELFEQIRGDRRVEGASIRSWLTVIVCTGARSGRPWTRRCRRRASPIRSEPRRRSTPMRQ
jgi:hypothetical protein